MIIDVNVNLSRWPFRRLRGDDPKELAKMLRARQIEHALQSVINNLQWGLDHRSSLACAI